MKSRLGLPCIPGSFWAELRNNRAGAPSKLTPARANAVILAVAEGQTLKEGCRQAGIHPATFCRWVNKYPVLAEALESARREAFRRKQRQNPRRRRAFILYRCPWCSGSITVNTAWGGLHFWVCGNCNIQAWRFPSPHACLKCHSATLYSYSKKSVQCVRCGHRHYLNSANVYTLTSSSVVKEPRVIHRPQDLIGVKPYQPSKISPYSDGLAWRIARILESGKR